MINANFKIQSGIEIPTGRYTNWPFEEMKVGDSFLVENGDIQALRSAATQVKRRSEGKFNYITKRVKDGYRCWRVA